jgi:aromatic ring-opening dioxygenase catalytic subunit (LigB family)
VGKLLKTIAVSHLPEVFAFVENPQSQPNWPQMRNFLKGLLEVGKRVREASPDVIVMSFDEHYVPHTPDFLVVDGAKHRATLEQYGIDYEAEYLGHPEIAREIFRKATEASLPVRMREAPDYDLFDFALLIPMLFMRIGKEIPVVPVLTHYVPEITLEGCVAMGRVIREVVESRSENAVLIVDGGLSHYICYPEKWDRLDDAFDRNMLKLLSEGKGLELVQYDHDALEEAGNDEIRQWLIGVGAVDRGTKAKVLAYEPANYFGLAVGAAVVDLQP